MPILNTSVIDQVSAAMSMKNLQHKVTASNIANRDTAGYQRLQLQFDRALGATQIVPDAAGNNVSLEQDLVAMFANSGQYQSMARVLNRYFAMLNVITSQNRG